MYKESNSQILGENNLRRLDMLLKSINQKWFEYFFCYEIKQKATWTSIKFADCSYLFLLKHPTKNHQNSKSSIFEKIKANRELKSIMWLIYMNQCVINQ